MPQRLTGVARNFRVLLVQEIAGNLRPSYLLSKMRVVIGGSARTQHYFQQRLVLIRARLPIDGRLATGDGANR